MITEITKAQFLVLQLGRLKDAGTMTPEQVSLAKRNNVNMATECARESRRLLGSRPDASPATTSRASDPAPASGAGGVG